MSIVVDSCLSIGASAMNQFIAEDDLARWMEEGGVDVQIAFQPDEAFHHERPSWNAYLGNDYISDVQSQFEGRVVGLGTVQVWHQPPTAAGSGVTRSPAIEEVDRCILELGLRGLRMNPIQHNYQFNNQTVVWPLLRRLSELQEQVGRQLIVSVHAYGDSLNNSPEAIALTAAEFPDLYFLMQHTAFIWGYGTVNDVAAPGQNILLDVSTMPQREVIAAAYREYGPDKFCIGCDGPNADWILRDAIVNDFARDEAEREKILGGTLAKVLGL